MASNPASTTVQNVTTTLTNCADVSDAYNELNTKMSGLIEFFNNVKLFEEEEKAINEYLLQNKTLNENLLTNISKGQYGSKETKKDYAVLKADLTTTMTAIATNNQNLNNTIDNLKKKITDHKSIVMNMLQPPPQQGGSKKSRKPRTKKPVTTKKSVKK